MPGIRKERGRSSEWGCLTKGSSAEEGDPECEGGRRRGCGMRKFDMIFKVIHRAKQIERTQGEIR